MVNILNIQIKLIFPTDCISTAHLSPACQAWTNFMSSFLFSGIQRKILHQKGSWSYYAHITFYNIKQFR